MTTTPYATRTVPPITTTVVITILFGIFGAIPAAIHSGRARDTGRPTNKYWKAFGIIMAVNVLLIVVLFAAAA